MSLKYQGARATGSWASGYLAIKIGITDDCFIYFAFIAAGRYNYEQQQSGFYSA